MKTFGTITFNEGFQPARIIGTAGKLEELGIKLLSPPSATSTMWDYENPKVEMPKRPFAVTMEWNDDGDCCDATFENGVVFGYVDEHDFVLAAPPPKAAKEESGGFIGLLASLVQLILKLLSRSDEKDKQKEIDEAKEELRKALAEGRVTDASYWRQRLQQLGSVAVAMAVVLFGIMLPGCATPKPTQPPQPTTPAVVVLGERINKPKPGQVIKVPELMPPAKQWYLVDDVGLAEWLGLKP